MAKGWSPLRRAVIQSNVELARILVAAGANPQITDDNGESMLFRLIGKMRLLNSSNISLNLASTSISNHMQDIRCSCSKSIVGTYALTPIRLKGMLSLSHLLSSTAQ